VDFMNQILDANNPLFAQIVRDDLVVSQRHALLVHLSVTTFVDEFTDGLQRGFPICDVRLNIREHGHRSKVHFDKGGAVQLEQPKELQNFFRFGCYAHDPSNAHEQKHLWHVFNKIVAIVFSLTFGPNE